MGEQAAQGISFPPTSLEAWRVAVGADAPPLPERTRCGVPLRHLHTEEDAERLRQSGEAPFPPEALRGEGRGWRIGQRHNHPDLSAAAAMIRDDLENGVDFLLLEFSQTVKRRAPVTPSARERGGFALSSIADWEALLPEDMPLPTLALDAGASALPLASDLLAFAEKRGVSAEWQAFLGLDPLAAWVGGTSISPQAECAAAAEVARQAARERSGVRAFHVSTLPYHLAGVSDTQELAVSMASGCAYMDAMLAAGMGAEEASGQLLFTLQADTDFFPQIAKFRAARLLWRRVVQAFGVPPENTAMLLHGESAWRCLTRYAPHVNIPRIATAGWAAVIGGADGVLLHPFTAALGVADAEARRMARNMHFLFAEEAMAGERAAVAAGSWCVDALTHDLAESAWGLFQEIHRHGGMVECLRSGWMGEMAREQREWRAREIATGVAPIVGVNVHPHEEEATPAVCEVDAEMRRRADARALKDMEKGGATASADTPPPPSLPQARESEGWERARDRGVAFAKGNDGVLPPVFLVTGGEGGGRRARVKDLLACGGMRIGGEAELTADVAAEFAKSGALFAIVMQGEESASAVKTAAGACLQAGARVVCLWRHGRGSGGEETPPFFLSLNNESDLPQCFLRIHDRLREADPREEARSR